MIQVSVGYVCVVKNQHFQISQNFDRSQSITESASTKIHTDDVGKEIGAKGFP